jgi:hypothetical protein
MDMEQWAMTYGSGTLRQALEWGMSWRAMALHERLAMEVATAAMAVCQSRLTVGTYMACPDDPVTTELGWYARTIRWRWSQTPIFKDASLKVVYFHLDEDGAPKEGAGFTVQNLNLPWIPKGKTILIPLAYWEGGRWTSHENPL